MTVPPPGSSSAIADDDVWRPLPTPVTVADGAVGVGHEPVDQRALADPRLPEQHARAAGQPGAQHLDARVVLRGPGDDDLDAERLVEGAHLVRRREVVLGEAQQRHEPAVVRRDQAPVDEPGARHGVGQRRDDDEHLGVGDDRPLDGVAVVGGAPQQRGAGLDAHDAAERVGPAAGVADDGDPVADDDRPPAELAGAHRREQAAVGRAEPVAAAVDAADDRRTRLVVRRTGARTGSRAAPGPHPDVVLVELARAHGRADHASMRSHDPTKSGTVLRVVATSRTCTPSTPRPRTAQAIATRWSS